jgi:hypothetical protein
MSEHDRLQRHCRVWLYVIALLYLVCLGLLQRPSQEYPHAESTYALQLLPDTSTLLPTARA